MQKNGSQESMSWGGVRIEHCLDSGVALSRDMGLDWLSLAWNKKGGTSARVYIIRNYPMYVLVHDKKRLMNLSSFDGKEVCFFLCSAPAAIGKGEKVSGPAVRTHRQHVHSISSCGQQREDEFKLS